MSEAKEEILVVEDNEIQQRLLEEVLIAGGYRASSVGRGDEIRMSVARSRPTVILLDLELPDGFGLDVLRDLQREPTTQDIPVIICSCHEEPEIIAEALMSGARDYISKPFDPSILLAKIQIQVAVSRKIQDLHENARKLKVEANHDSLTGLLNRRSMDRALDKEISRSLRYERVFSILLIDIDWFKKVNDQYGHLAGDAVLREIAFRISSFLRKIDSVYRYGGEEFCVLLPETPPSEAVLAAEKIRSLIAEAEIQYEDASIPVTVSIGVAELQRDSQAHGTTILQLELLKQADQALYQAKSGGRNRVCALDEIPAGVRT